MLAVRPLLNTLVARNAAVLSRSYQSHHKAPTLNDLPVPEGDFYALHAQRNRRYNAILVGGIVIFGFTLFVAKESKLIHLNYSPPENLD